MSEQKSKINAQVQSLTEIWEKAIEVTETNGKWAATAAEDTFANNLPEGQTIEQYKAMGEHIDNTVSAVANAYGRIATKAVAEGKCVEADGRRTLDLEAVLWGKNRLNVAYTAEKTNVTKNPRNPEEIITTVKHGDMRVQLEMNADANRGQLKAVKQEINDLAAEAFAAGNK